MSSLKLVCTLCVNEKDELQSSIDRLAQLVIETDAYNALLEKKLAVAVEALTVFAGLKQDKYGYREAFEDTERSANEALETIRNMGGEGD